ncbi:pimeloyl-ACP methyl ester carboxylesterase [Paenibacillus forsythiae]|uniref:Pimeloyl-ACP methyl ester carboxylesterase n=1 Tax=Paenibacillus forsythiae TaxID=365616 RepID=A0ABU3H908_9BACL|nr:alpha/beta hydrolase [Paenibacillus forsythiae]MDT3427304.1 pimeloyl-ACP methyl ester carboxylesterase [Paenibacillus forsythiae]
MVLLFAIPCIARFIVQKIIKHHAAIDATKGIEILEKVTVGGINQWIYIRGECRENPVLLWVDGGPGEPCIAYARDLGHLNGLERKFTIVYWDQRGTGKSYSESIPAESMTIAQYVSDIRELTMVLKVKLGVEKVYLLGRSWGSRIGALAASKHPELFYAYIAVGQAVHSDVSELISIRNVLHIAKETNNKEAIQELESIGSPPYTPGQILVERKWVQAFGGFSKSGLNLRSYILKKVLSSPEYTIRDVRNVIRRGTYPNERLRPEINGQNLFVEAPGIEIPVYFIHGKHDLAISGEVAEAYYKSLEAPMGKSFFWFENSAHTANADESDKFYDVMVNNVLKNTQ